VLRPAGSRLGEHTGDAVVSLWRRAAATGRRMVKSALALGELRRETDRELALPPIISVRDKIGDLEATLATAVRKKDGKTALPGPEIARLAAEHARVKELWSKCTSHQAELRTAEELCLEALARDVDAIDLIDAAIATRNKFRRDLFWLITAMRPIRPGATLLVHSPDARAAVRAWTMMAMQAASAHSWRPMLHIWGDKAPGWIYPWGPPRDLAWAEENLAERNPAALLVRIAGSGADLLFGLEAGLHRFHGLAGEACHAWVDALEPRTEFADATATTTAEWLALPGPPVPRVPRGTPMRDVAVNGDRTVVEGEELDLPWPEIAQRLEESAVVRVLSAVRDPEGADDLWKWEHPIAAAAAAKAAT
jgi:hypothetical protein